MKGGKPRRWDECKLRRWTLFEVNKVACSGAIEGG